MNHKLVLFDIDGTLIFHLKTHRFEDQYEYALKQVFGIDAYFDLSKFNGTVDRHNSWEMARQHGITREVFLQKFPDYVRVMHEVLLDRSKNQQLYQPIPSARMFVEKLHRYRPEIHLGVITGNSERIARWKLQHTGLSEYFPFGLYGDEADDRIELAGLVFAKAKRQLHVDFAPKDITVIGDTMYDIRCAKAIGAVTIGVTTGYHGVGQALAEEKPDFLVDSLTDKRVLALFSLK